MRHDWNVLVTSRSGHQRALTRAFQDLGDFEVSASRDVMVGVVRDRYMFLDTVASRLARGQRLPACLGRLLPVDRTITLPPGAPDQALGNLVAELAPQIGARSYHVRLDVHGHRELHGRRLELVLADRAWDALAGAGHHPVVCFEDPDVVLQVEVVGDTAGAALLDRRMRETYPFLLVR